MKNSFYYNYKLKHSTAYVGPAEGTLGMQLAIARSGQAESSPEHKTHCAFRLCPTDNSM